MIQYDSVKIEVNKVEFFTIALPYPGLKII